MTDIAFDAASAARGLPQGVGLRHLAKSGGGPADGLELFCREWASDTAPIQWNFVHSRPDSLRGVHVHLAHWDYLCVLDGEMLLGLHDMRPASPTYRRSALQRLRGDEPSGLTIPPGVAHGFYFAADTRYVYGINEYWSMADELGCTWNDPELRLDWPTTDPLRSPRDRAAPSYATLAGQLADAARAGRRP